MVYSSKRLRETIFKLHIARDQSFNLSFYETQVRIESPKRSSELETLDAMQHYLVTAMRGYDLIRLRYR